MVLVVLTKALLVGPFLIDFCRTMLPGILPLAKTLAHHAFIVERQRLGKVSLVHMSIHEAQDDFNFAALPVT
jgi:hypothetical protein